MEDTNRYALPIGTMLRSPEREYQIESVLGHGGFGITYKVSAKTEKEIRVGNITQIQTFKLYFAVKEFFMKGCDRGEDGQTITFASTLESDIKMSLEDFMTEAERLNVIGTRSQYIVKVNEVFKANGTAYYVMEYLDGGSLQDYIMRHGALSWNDTTNIIKPIAKAVKLLHEERLLHMDIKPDNIIFKSDNNGVAVPVLIDFGIAKHFDSNGKPTSHLMAKGASDGYAPMEQYVGIDTFAPEIDVYALGATMLYMLAGKQPPKSSEIRSAKSVIAMLPISLTEQQKAIVSEAMNPSRYERTQNVDSLLKSLGNVGDKHEKEEKKPIDTNKTKVIGQKNKKIEPTPKVEKKKEQKDDPKPDPQPRSYKKVVVAALLVLLGGVLWGYFRNDDSDDASAALTNAISANDIETLRVYAELDSMRAFYPYAECLLQKGDTTTAMVYVEKAKLSVDSTQAKQLLTKISQEKEAKKNVAIKTKQSGNTTSTEQNKSNEQEKTNQQREENVEKQTDNETDEQKYSKAVAKGDNATIKALASKGYAKAYSKAASIYLKEDNYSSADAYARRALRSNVGRTDAINVIEILDCYGYYDNGDHGGKPAY